MLKYAFAGLAAVLMSGAIHIYAQGPSRTSREATGTPVVACADLTGRTLDGSASITQATRVTGGTIVISPTVTLTDLPPFCRVQAVSKPSPDSNIVFEVWLPEPANWNSKFLSSGEGGFAGGRYCG